MMAWPDIHEWTGAYVLDAILPDERWAFEQHVDDCAVCRREVRELREAVVHLAVAASKTPMPALRDRLMASLDRLRQRGRERL